MESNAAPICLIFCIFSNYTPTRDLRLLLREDGRPRARGLDDVVDLVEDAVGHLGERKEEGGAEGEVCEL